MVISMTMAHPICCYNTRTGRSASEWRQSHQPHAALSGASRRRLAPSMREISTGGESRHSASAYGSQSSDLASRRSEVLFRDTCR